MNAEELSADLTIIGGGIVGLATALTALCQNPELSVVLLETENGLAQHQTGNNSGVLHSGIYYKPGSEKAILCRRGKHLIEEFCNQHSIGWERCGKVIVATDAAEVAQLDSIAQRGHANGVECSFLTPAELRQREPAAKGVAALLVPESGIVNFRHVALAFAEQIRKFGGKIHMSARVERISEHGQGITIHCANSQTIDTKFAIACAGLHSDRIFELAKGTHDHDDEIQIVPFRGEYYQLTPAASSLCRHLIYPVPDPSFPFLGVHFTRMIDGGVECGPNAVLALSRSGYRWRDMNWTDSWQTIRFQGFRKLAQKHWRMGLTEMHRSLRKGAFVNALRRLVPQIREQDLMTARAGVRAQAVRSDGTMVDDFLFARTPHMLHVLNAPSPAATASLAIAERILEKLIR